MVWAELLVEPLPLRVRVKVRVVAHACNPSIWEVQAGGQGLALLTQ